jgi:hypothetical protein
LALAPWFALAAVLAGAALLKVVRARASADALASFGLQSRYGRWVALAGAVGAELGLAAGVAAGSLWR